MSFIWEIGSSELQGISGYKVQMLAPLYFSLSSDSIDWAGCILD